jgi:hypothetical protein
MISDLQKDVISRDEKMRESIAELRSNLTAEL